MRCGFKRTIITVGPRGSVKSKTWQCSRTGKHFFIDKDVFFNVENEIYLCSQHLKVANKNHGKNETYIFNK